MFRCDNCGSGYSVQAAATWDSCPRCLAKHQVHTPLAFELGWRRASPDAAPMDGEADRPDPTLSATAAAPAAAVASG
ncbi:MAG TPA: hypothetical protein VFW48_04130 [Solirubrobacterales bacterium]|nr:hypothetical protein [Solirubrobacterales bacterium]